MLLINYFDLSLEIAEEHPVAGTEFKDYIAIIFGAAGLCISLYNLWRSRNSEKKSLVDACAKTRRELITIIARSEASALSGRRLLSDLSREAKDRKDNQNISRIDKLMSNLNEIIEKTKEGKDLFARDIPKNKKEQISHIHNMEKIIITFIKFETDDKEGGYGEIADAMRDLWGRMDIINKNKPNY